MDIVQPGTVHLLHGEADDSQVECDRLNQIISQHQIDVAFVGIGENGHLAFNDPPADFETEDPYIVVELDEACRLQQVGEGWFNGLDDVPTHAISMSIHQIMKSKTIICTVPDERKAEAVRNCLYGEITPMHPASILQKPSGLHSISGCWVSIFTNNYLVMCSKRRFAMPTEQKSGNWSVS